MTSLTFTVPVAPRPKPRAGRNGKRTFTPSGYAAYETVIRTRAFLALGAANLPMFLGPLKIDYVFFLASNRGDVDNYVKGVQDAMNAIVYRDDTQVQVITAAKISTSIKVGGKLVRMSKPGIRVTVTALPPDWADAYHQEES